MATGVLVLLFGEATKLSSALSSADKLYRARVTFGFATDTDDAMGTPTRRGQVPSNLLENKRLTSALAAELERTLQIPPRFSAIKTDGIPHHRLARLKIDVPLEPRLVKVRQLRILGFGIDHLDLELLSSKGYYVRSLARDLGDRLDCPAHLSALCRLQTGAFNIESATRWPPETASPLMSVARAARLAIPSFELTEEGMQRARMGQILTLSDFVKTHKPAGSESVMAWLYQDDLIALGVWCDESTLRVIRGFVPARRA
jgi:tRNA pseudouridine55 synthase